MTGLQTDKAALTLPVVCLLFLAAGLVCAQEQVPKVIFLFNEADKVIASNAQTGQFFELALSAKEQLVDQYTANGAAIVVTNQRFAGIGIFPGGWQSIRRIAGEEIVSAETGDYSGLLVTTDRLLSFNGRTGGWSQKKR